MKKTTARTAARRRTPTTKPVTSPIPPIVAALAMYCDPGQQSLPPAFQIAWMAVPGILAEWRDEHDSREPVWTYIDRQAKAAIADSRTATERHEQLLAKGVDLLEQTDLDYLHQVQSAYSEPAFHIGLALGLYLALNGGGTR